MVKMGGDVDMVTALLGVAMRSLSSNYNQKGAILIVVRALSPMEMMEYDGLVRLPCEAHMLLREGKE